MKIKPLQWSNGPTIWCAKTAVGNCTIFQNGNQFRVYRSVAVVDGMAHVKFTHPSFDTLKQAKDHVQQMHTVFLKSFITEKKRCSPSARKSTRKRK